MSLVQFFRILYARRWILIAAVGSALLAALVTIQLLPPRYTGVARVMLDVIKPDPVTGQVLGTQFLRAYTRTQIELIKDYQIAEQVVDQMGWAQNPEINAQYAARQDNDPSGIRRWLAKQVIENTDARLIQDSNILEISYRSSNPVTSKQIVDLIRAAYMESSLANKRESAGKTADWYREQATQAEQLVKAAEAERANFAAANNIVLQADNTDLESSRLNALSSQSAVEVVQPGVMGGGGGLGPAQIQLEQINQQIAQAGQTLGPQHPAFQALERQRIVVEKAAAAERAAARPGGAPAGAARAQLNEAYERQKVKVVAQSGAIDRINRMTRDIELKREQLAKIAERASDSRLQANVGETGMSPLGEPIAPDSPEFPNKPLILVASLGFGAALGVILSLLVELLGRRIRSQEDLEYAAAAPVFAEIAARAKKDSAMRKFIKSITDRTRQRRAVPASAE